MTDDEIENKISSIFYSRMLTELDRVKSSGLNFVHYTSADAALSIIKNNCIWLRNSQLMNDYSEVQHGVRCLEFAWHSEHGARLQNLLDKVQSGLSADFAAAFDRDIIELTHETFLISISEHDVSEDDFGRLSMWRAYGGSASVALVFDQKPFVSPSDALHAYTVPVFYGGPQEYLAEFSSMVDRIEANFDFLTNLQFDSEWFARTLMDTIRFSVLSTKHPGFREEREWRVVYCPMSNASDNIFKDDVSVNGVPQRIYKIPFVNHPDQGFEGATLPESLRRVIIGPIASPYPTYQTFNDILAAAGVGTIEAKLVCSSIPLRS